ncbi:ParB-like nuclease domain protein [Mycobacterium phage Arissanae]|nr:ParB-like nuclease domain protein [Mycobacterium phage Arissanae]
MTSMLDQDTLTLDEVKALQANDVAGLCGPICTVEESGKYLEQYYLSNSRSISGDQTSPPVYGGFWTKVGEIAAILKDADEWPFPPLVVRDKTLYNGHHRSNAAIMAGWDKEIPVTTDFGWW